LHLLSPYFISPFHSNPELVLRSTTSVRNTSENQAFAMSSELTVRFCLQLLFLISGFLLALSAADPSQDPSLEPRHDLFGNPATPFGMWLVKRMSMVSAGNVIPCEM
jgi:hypothetical protein